MTSPENEITSLLRRLGITSSSVTRLEESSFGSKVYRIETDRQTKVLKLFYGSREYWRERKTLELLQATGFVPQVLDGLPSIDGFDGALLLEYIENENLASSRIDDSAAHSTGVRLAQIHKHSLGMFGFFGPEGVEPYPFQGWWSFRRYLLTNDWASFVRKRLDEKFVRRCCDHIEWSSKSFHDDEPTCLTHCDFRFGNVLRRRDGQLSVIDFESAREGDGAYDFIKIWEQIGRGQDGREWASFLQGYATARPLPDNLKAKLEYYWFDLNFGYLYWAIDRGDEPLFQQRLKIVEGLLEGEATVILIPGGSPG